MEHKLKYCILLSILVCFSGCAKARVYYPGNRIDLAETSTEQLGSQTFWRRVEHLEHELAGLSSTVDRTEARRVAETAIRASAVLAEEYQLIKPAVVHNVFIQLGLKDRGLCYHWTEDLLHRLQALNLKSFSLHWGVAHRGSNLREHNCVVITAKGQDFFEGILLDAWRNSGNLYWTQVTKDHYPWKRLPQSDW
jgi:hypothetical protein